MVKNRRWLFKANRDMLKFSAGGIVLMFVFGFALGWALAPIVLLAAVLGFQVGHMRGFKGGMDKCYADQLRGILAALTDIENHAAEELAPHDPVRVGLARERATVLEELRRVA